MLDIKNFDEMLDTGNGGPLVQSIRMNGTKLTLRFEDSGSRDKAKDVLQSKQDIFSSVSPISKLYPVIVKHVDIEPPIEDTIQALALRNPILDAPDMTGRVIYKSADGKVGHIKLLLNSKGIRDEIIKSGELFLPDRKCDVVLPDPNREVRRCFNCQKYGHTKFNCNEIVCGKCCEKHDTRSCKINDPRLYKCAVCLSKPAHSRTTSTTHMAGDRNCPEQRKAVERYIKFNH